MKTRIFFVLAAIGLLASCAKEQAIQNDNVLPDGQGTPAGVTTLTVGLTEPEALAPQNTKTHMDIVVMEGKHKVYWSNGDQIAVNGVSSEPLSEIPEYSQTADFNFDAVLSTPYSIVYPASIYADATHVALPAIQDYRAGGFAEGMYPMAGYSADGQGITLGYPCAMVKISVLRAAADADEDNLIAVRFKGRNDEQVCGSFAIDYETATLTGTSTAAADKEVKVIAEQATSTSAAAVYYVVVPAGTYSNGFDIIVQDKKGHIMTQPKTAFQTLEAGHLYTMPEFAFVPTATEVGVEIASAQDLIQFATDYNNEVYVPLGDALVATLTSDITFDAETSAAFDATKGIASVSSENYFHGIFDGAGHTISGLSATVPLFAAIGSSGIAKNFTMDNTCSFTFTHPNTTDANFGAAVGYHKGVLDNVTVAADVTLAAVSGVAYETCLGGLVGRETEGTIDNCTYFGALSIPSGFASADKKIQIGGLVGRISNAKGKVLNSDFEGTLENEGKMVASSEADDLKNNPYLMIGGIVGLNSGTVSNCSVSNHATGITVTLTDSSDHNYTGTLVTHSTNAYHYALAGIAGRNDGTVADCTNNAAIVNIFSAERGTGGNMNGRYLEVGGVVGFNSASMAVSGCTNNGAIISRANPKMHRLGGVVGWNYGTILSCSNSSTGGIGVGTSHLTPYGARQLYLGGVVGDNNSGTVSDVQNAGAIVVSRLENDNAMTFIGGVIGQSSSAIDGGGSKNISNSGNITQSYTCGTIPVNGYNLGGVVGLSTASISNVSNTGNVAYTKAAGDSGSESAAEAGYNLGGVVGKTSKAISGSTNSGRVYMTNKHTGASTSGGYNLGGIAGISESTITDCSNSGMVDYTISVALAYAGGFNLGGIAGVNGGAVSTSTNSGEVYFENSSTGSAAGGYNVGGIVGAAKADITGSDNTGYIHHAHTGAALTTKIHIGGIAGYMIQSATISECDNLTTAADNSGTVYLALNTGYKHTENSIGGVLGCTPVSGVNAALEDCSNAGKVYGGVNSKQNGCPLYVGGIVAYLAGESSLDNCDNSGEVWNNQANNTSTGTGATYNGGVVGYAKGTADERISISDCDNTSAIMHSRRGIVGGIAAYAQYANFTSCKFTQSIPSDGVNLCYWVGGIAGWADQCTLTSCTYSGGELSGTQVQANGVGGMAAQLTNSIIDGCTSSVETMKSQLSGSWANVAGGAMVGVSGTGNTIKNCHYKPTINGSSAKIAGSGTFTDGGGNTADL